VRSRLLDDVALPGLAALLEGLWLGAAVVVFVHQSVLLLVGLSAALVGIGGGLGVLARRTALGVGLLRGILMAMAGAAVAGLVAVQRPESWRGGLELAFGELIGVTLALWIGVRAGRLVIRPEDALRRVARVLAFVLIIVLLTRLQGVDLPHAGPIVAGVMVVGALFIALARLDDVLAVVDRRHGVSSWGWFLGVMTAVAAVLVGAALLAVVTHGGPLLWTVSLIGHLAWLGLDVVGYIVGWAGYGVLRAFVLLADLAHLPKPHGFQPHEAPQLHTATLPKMRAHTATRLTFVRDLLYVFAVTLGIGAVLFALSRALRRYAPESERENVEERESLLSASELARSLRTRLARLTSRRRRMPLPASPNEAVRRDFAQLETSLARIGRPREPATTVRAFLLSCGASAMAEAMALAHTYEMARYSSRSLSWEQARQFHDSAVRYVAVLQSSGGSGGRSSP